MDKNQPYTVTIYVAASGTKQLDPQRPDVVRGTSMTGHMYLETVHGNDRASTGWQPDTPIPGGGYLGAAVTTDVRTYADPYYARTIEVTQAQFEKIREFSTSPQ